MLRDHTWKKKYTRGNDDLVESFYIPALKVAKRYDRLTGYFKARALSLATRGIEGLVHNQGEMRLIVGCTLDSDEVEAIKRGERIRDHVEQNLTSSPLNPSDSESKKALEFLAWMVSENYLDVKVAVSCDDNGEPVSKDESIFHAKIGIIEDGDGDKIAWNGSLNETVGGWRRNWESFSVYTSWEDEERVEIEEADFSELWSGEAKHVIILDVPEAVRQNLMEFMPKDDKPSRLIEFEDELEVEEGTGEVEDADRAELRARVWSYIKHAPSMPSGMRMGEETSPVIPWPHQARTFERLYRSGLPRLLIADEVGLGKTIQAGMLLRQVWLSGRAKRILVLAPKAVLNQWQLELREKFNLNWPIYDGHNLIWYPSPASCDKDRSVSRDQWHLEPTVITSSHLMRRDDRAEHLLENTGDWDLVVLDEAHHARRSAAGSRKTRGPNKLLKLMQKLRDRTEGLLLLTATPMQVHPRELWDLLHLLGLPQGWEDEDTFFGFFKDTENSSPPPEAWERMARLFRSSERQFGKVAPESARQLTSDPSMLNTKKILDALWRGSDILRRRLDTGQRASAIKIMRVYTPVRHLVSRHTRELLREYHQKGVLMVPIAKREVNDRFIAMTGQERDLYDEVEEYISSTYNRARDRKNRNAVGFVMTIYRRRLASSFFALSKTLQKHMKAISEDDIEQIAGQEEDVFDDETSDEVLDAGEVAVLEREALATEEKESIQRLLDCIKMLPPDSKLGKLEEALEELRRDGCEQVMVFTQFTDTMDFLREKLKESGHNRLMCFSGRGGEIPLSGGSWKRINRDEVKRSFRNGDADILLCTDAAAEGLNFQFCGALINYDMPWNPMRVEQRIGRIDRLGQKNEKIRILNFHYEDTVETDVYKVLMQRIGLFTSFVGRLQPILSRLPQAIQQSVLSGDSRTRKGRSNIVEATKERIDNPEEGGFDINEMQEKDLVMPDLPPSPVSMSDLDRIINSPDLLPQGIEIRSIGERQYSMRGLGMGEPVRVTTDPAIFERHPESIELWSPGNPLFNPPEDMPQTEEAPSAQSLKELLDEGV